MELFCLRMPPELVRRLKIQAHTESLTGHEITWAGVARRAIQQYVSGLDATKAPPASPIADVPTRQAGSDGKPTEGGFDVQNDAKASFDF